MSIPALISSSDREKIKIKAKEILEKLDLFDRLNHKPNELSGGEQQRVAIARSLINSPDIVFADEPTGNLDSSSSKEIIKLIEELNQGGLTLVVVTHDKQLGRRSNRLIELLDGKIINDNQN